MRSANTGTAAAGASAVADATLATAASQGLSLAEQAERFNDPVAVPPSSPTVSSTGSGPRDLSTAALEAAALAAARERLNMPIGRKGHHTKGALELDDSDQEGVDTLGHIKKAPSLNVCRGSVSPLCAAFFPAVETCCHHILSTYILSLLFLR